MVIEWISQTGSQRTVNHDSGAYFISGPYLVAIIVDAAEKGSQGQAFSYFWSQTVAANLKANPAQLQDPTAAVECLKTTHLTLRGSFLKEVASYCVVVLDCDNRNGYLLATGDCRVGISKANQSIKWLNEPHRLSQFMPQQFELTSHILTRSLNVRRFSRPEFISFCWPSETALVLCSDGCWDCCEDIVWERKEAEDDRSFLRMVGSPEEAVVTLCSDVDNFFCLN